MTEYQWDRFKRMKYTKANLGMVFDYWTKPGLIVKWFLKEAYYTDINGISRSEGEYPQKGDDYHWVWLQGIETRGRVLDVVQDKLFEVTFGKNGETGEDVVVSVTFEHKDGETMYFLEQKNMGGDLHSTAHYHLSCNKGWDYFMTNLKLLLAHGIDLREQDPTRAYNELAVSL